MPNPIPNSGPHPIAASEDASEDSRSGMLVPIILAVIILAALAVTLVHYTYHSDFASGMVLTTRTYAVHRDAPPVAGMQVVGAGAEDSLYVIPDIEIRNHLSMPITVESMSMELVLGDGSTLQCIGAHHNDFDTVFARYPELAGMEKLTGGYPLDRDTQIETGAIAHGNVMVHFPIPLEVWQHRQSAHDRHLLPPAAALHPRPLRPVTLPPFRPFCCTRNKAGVSAGPVVRAPCLLV